MASIPTLGSTIAGKYKVVRLLGEGGMGAVFEVENTVTQKRVAIKWLHPEFSRHEGASERLLREAQAASRVRHPNVVDVYDVERDGDAVFLVMEYLEGETLSRALKRRDMRMHQVIQLLLPAMRGVAAAHKQGVIHRDIKPDNIFLAREEDVAVPVPKVLDFGVSRLDARGAEQLSLTRSGSTVGTPLYMSYEQLSGVRDLDGRTDVYAFGVILYEALTGQPPFDATSLTELVVKIATQQPIPAKELRSDIPTSLATLVMSAIAKHRDERVPSMEALIRQLEPFATDRGFRAEMTLPGATLPSLGAASDASFEAANRALRARETEPLSPLPHERAAVRLRSDPPSAVTGLRSTLPRQRVITRRRTTTLVGAAALMTAAGVWIWSASSAPTAVSDVTTSAGAARPAGSKPDFTTPPPLGAAPKAAQGSARTSANNQDWVDDRSVRVEVTSAPVEAATTSLAPAPSSLRSRAEPRASTSGSAAALPGPLLKPALAPRRSSAASGRELKRRPTAEPPVVVVPKVATVTAPAAEPAPPAPAADTPKADSFRVSKLPRASEF